MECATEKRTLKEKKKRKTDLRTDSFFYLSHTKHKKAVGEIRKNKANIKLPRSHSNRWTMRGEENTLAPVSISGAWKDKGVIARVSASIGNNQIVKDEVIQHHHLK